MAEALLGLGPEIEYFVQVSAEESYSQVPSKALQKLRASYR